MGRYLVKSCYILALPMALAVFFAFMLPYGASFLKAFDGPVTVWENSSLLRITIFTIKQAFFSTLVSLVIGLPGAWFLGSGKNRPVLRTLTAIPFAMPSILVVLGFVLFFGNSGWINKIIFAVSGREGSLKILYGSAAIVLAHGFFNFPLVIRLVGDGLEPIKKGSVPAAASLGSPPLMTFFNVILPLCFPSILSASLLAFLYSFTSFAVVLVLGGGPASTTLPVEIYRHAKIFLNYHNAGALALAETAIAVTIFTGYVLIGKKFKAVKTGIDDHGFEKLKHTSGLNAGKIFTALYIFAASILVLGPLASILLESFLWQPSRSARQVFGLVWWTSLGKTCLPALLRSLALALLSASIAIIFAALAAAAVKMMETRSNLKNKNSITVNLIRFFAAAPIVSSGIVLGMGWLILYGQHLNSASGGNFFFTIFTLVILHAVMSLPFAFNSISEGFRVLPDNILNAASALGAGPTRLFFTIALPLSLKHLRSAWGFAAALSLGELNAIMMLGKDNWETLPLYIYRAAGAYRYGNACAAGTLLIICFALCLLISEKFKNA